MKLVLAFVLAVTFSVSRVTAQDAVESCKGLANTAEMIMKGRQAGADIIKMYEIASESGEAAEFFEGIVTAAYESPRYRQEASKERAISEFKSEVMVQCVNALRSEG